MFRFKQNLEYLSSTLFGGTDPGSGRSSPWCSRRHDFRLPSFPPPRPLGKKLSSYGIETLVPVLDAPNHKDHTKK
jgi:hypothetical protein